MNTQVKERITVGEVRSIKDPVKRALKVLQYYKQSAPSGYAETVGFLEEGFAVLMKELAQINAIAARHPEHLGDN
jgi:hypothetical protein